LKNILGEVSAEAYKTAAAPSTSTSTSGGGAATDSAGVGPTPEEFAKGTSTSDTTPPP